MVDICDSMKKIEDSIAAFRKESTYVLTGLQKELHPDVMHPKWLEKCENFVNQEGKTAVLFIDKMSGSIKFGYAYPKERKLNGHNTVKWLPISSGSKYKTTFSDIDLAKMIIHRESFFANTSLLDMSDGWNFFQKDGFLVDTEFNYLLPNNEEKDEMNCYNLGNVNRAEINQTNQDTSEHLPEGIIFVIDFPDLRSSKEIQLSFDELDSARKLYIDFQKYFLEKVAFWNSDHILRHGKVISIWI